MFNTRFMRKKYKEYVNALNSINLDDYSTEQLVNFEKNSTQNLTGFNDRINITQGCISQCNNYLIYLHYYPTLFSGIKAVVTRYKHKLYTEQLKILQDSASLTERFLIRVRWRLNILD